MTKILDEIRKKDAKERISDASTMKKKLAVLSMDRYTKQSKNLRERKNMRKNLARILTVIREEELTHETK